MKSTAAIELCLGSRWAEYGLITGLFTGFIGNKQFFENFLQELVEKRKHVISAKFPPSPVIDAFLKVYG